MHLVRIEYKQLKRINLLNVPMLMTLAVSYELKELIEKDDVQRMIEITEYKYY